MDKYLKYLNSNLEQTLGKKITIGSTTKILGAKTDEEVEEMRANGKKILDITTEEGLRLGDIKQGNILYETFEQFKEELTNKGVDYDHINDAWFVWREERMAEKLESFSDEIKAQLETLVKQTIEGFHDKAEVEE